MTFNTPTRVEDEHHQTFAFAIEVRMTGNVRFPIGGCLIGCFALLHGIGGGTFSKWNNFPFLWLSREFERLDEVVLGLWSGCGASGGDEGFCCVHVLRFVLKGAGLLSSPPPRESRTAPNETHPRVPRPSGSGARSNRVTAGAQDPARSSPAGAKLRGATRGRAHAGWTR